MSTLRSGSAAAAEDGSKGRVSKHEAVIQHLFNMPLVKAVMIERGEFART